MAKQEFGDEAGRWAERIGNCWRKTVAGIIETGRILRMVHPMYGDPKVKLNYGEWGCMFTEGAVPKKIPFGQDYAGILMTIAGNQILADPDNCRNLPATISVLYDLARLPDEILAAIIRKITPETKRKHIAAFPEVVAIRPRKSLVQPRPEKRPDGWEDDSLWLDPEWWGAPDIIAATRRFALKQLRASAPGKEHLVGHVMRAIAHEILTPLPYEVSEELYREREWLLILIDDFLHDRRALCGWIRSNGGLKRGDLKGELEGIPGAVARQIFQKGGRSLDDLAMSLAAEINRPEREVARQMLDTLTKADDSAPKRRQSRIKEIDAILDDRALKTGYVPIYVATDSRLLESNVVAEMRRASQPIKERLHEKAKQARLRKRRARARRIRMRGFKPQGRSIKDILDRRV
jgi:hypothetical protein